MNSYYRYGFTGTANKNGEINDMKVQAHFGDILFEATMDFTVKIGKSAKPKVFIVKYNTEYKPLKYQDAYQYHIVNGKERNNKIVELTNNLLSQNKSVLIMVNFIEHGKLLEKELNIPFIYGDDDINKIQQVLHDFNSGKEKAIIISTIGDEGLNIARADAVILGGAGKSQIRTIQRIGRALRTYKGKKSVDVYDFFDSSDDTLLAHTFERIATYKKQNIEIEEI
jgi:superfamily II DNA or RNA helicase